jgi:LPXTG-site transpeptidase (sortase) family protein
MILAAHSGTAGVAYFEHLDELKTNDEIYLTYNKKDYIYKVIEIWEEEKTGFIHINKEKEKQLILTTCSPKKDGYQLVINCIKKES